MTRNPEYRLFLDIVGGRKDDDLRPDEETVATPQEIGWWKRFQIGRAIHHARYGIATSIELHLLKEHGIFVSRMAKVRTESREK